MPSLVFDVSALDRASQAFERIANRIDMLIARLAALNASSANPRLDVDTDPAERTLGRWAMDFKRRTREALAEIPTVDITVRTDLSDVETDMQRVRAELASLLDKEIGVDIDAAAAIAQIETLRDQVKALDLTDANVQVKTDVAAALAALEAVLAKAREVEASDPEVEVKVDKDKGIRDIINAAALFQRSLQQFGKPIAIVGAIPGLVSLADSLIDLLGLLGLVPAAAFGALAAIAALTVGFQGFGAALGAMDDPAKFAEALKELTPAAREAAISIRGLAEAWEPVQAAVQQALFEGVAQQLDALRGMLPTVQAGLVGMAGALNNIFTSWAQWATQIEPTRELAVIFEGVRAATQELAPGITAVAQALTDMAVVGARMLPDLAAGFSEWATGWADWIAEITANGQFEAWVQNAIDTLGQLMDIGGNLWGAFQGFFDAAETAGVGFLDSMQRITQSMEDFTNSVEGQAGIVAFFDTVTQIINNLLPGIEAIGRAFLEAFIGGGPLLAALADGLSQLAEVGTTAIGVVVGFLSGLTPLASAIAGLIDLLGPLAGYVLGAFLVFRTAGVILTGFATTLTFVAGAIRTAGMALAGLATGSLAAGITTATTGIVAAFRGVATFLTGPFGIAILGAIAVIGLLASGEDDAAAAAERHQSRVQSLIGTLDQYTGAVTQATQSQIAQELAQQKLSDGTTTLASAVQKAGINFQDFAAAASGNDEMLQKVNAQLVAVASNTIRNSDAFALWERSITNLNIPMETIAAAALGNVQAMEELTTKYNLGSDSARLMTEAFRESLGPLAEVGMTLGDVSGSLQEAQDAARLAADAQADLAARLREGATAISQYKDAIDLSTGAINPAVAGATQLAEAFARITQDAQGTANNVGRVRAETDGLAAGAQEAANSMAQSRAAFIGMATDAGLGAQAAENLADQLGLIPEVARIIFETNADETEAALIRVMGAYLNLPAGTHTIIVEALTDEAIAALDAIGIKAQELENGQFKLTIDDAEFYAKLQAAIAAGQTLPEFLATLTLDTAPADAEHDAFKGRVENNPFNKPIVFETGAAEEQLDGWRVKAEEPVISALQMDPAAADAALGAWQARAQVPVVAPLDADSAPAMGKLSALVGAITGTTAIMTIDANEAPAMGKLAATVGAVNGAVGVMTIDGDNGPALAKLAAAVGAANGAVGTMTIDGNNGPAIAAARAAVAAINAMSATITITRRIVTVGGGAAGAAIGSGGAREASGGMVPMRFATGGVVPGYAPGLDRVPALLSPGEGILVPEAVRLLGAKAIANLNRLASGGRKAAFMSKTGARAYASFGTPGGLSGSVPGTGGQPIIKNFYLTVQNAGNSEVNLREQFRQMEVLGL